MTKRIGLHISSAFALMCAVASCTVNTEIDDALKVHAAQQSEIGAKASIGNPKTMAGASLPMDEWSLIDQVTTRKLDANFLRIDEGITAGNGNYTFGGGEVGKVVWDKSYLCEATVISSPENTEGIHYRSIIFSPRQAYAQLTTHNPLSPSENDTTNFYHTRMVGWYPRNCDLVIKDGSQQFESSTEQDASLTIDGHNYKAVRFTGLDGSKDIMVSNVCEGQHWHSSNSANSPYTSLNNNEPYRLPFGHYQWYHDGEFKTLYSNYFKFRHYLSGVRFWGFVPEQNTHALDMWGNITDVVLLNQPTSVCVTLPEEPLYYSNGSSLSWEDEEAHFGDAVNWGQAFGWDDFDNLSVQTGPMFGDDTNHSGENFSVDFGNISMKGVGDQEHAVYMGYSLVRPDHSVEVEIHTRYGVYVTTVQPRYTYTYVDSNGDEQTETVDIFKAGYYYDVYLSLQTDGTISAIIETRGDERYYDLTRSVIVSPTGMAEDEVTSYRYANCYVVDPQDDSYDSDGDGVCDYSGFFFSGMVAGNGNDGILRYNSQSFYPSSAELSNPVTAHLIWESSRSLVTDIELINGYIKFKVPGVTDALNYSGSGVSKVYNGPKGNAVIGVYDQDDVCLWSWHIWITDTPANLTYITDNVVVMDRNLGAVYGLAPANASNALLSYGLYYQWGRKDPSVGPPVWNYAQQDGSTAVFYDYASDEVDAAIPMSKERPSLSDGVENPMYLILPTRKSDKGYTLDWLYFEPENILWGYDHSLDKMSKTIYDPCPFGYRVPAGELTSIMENSTYSTTSYGIKFTGNIKDSAGKNASLFFPYAGYKGVDKSLAALTLAWNSVGTKGDYQEARYDTSISGGTLYYRKRLFISSATTWKEDLVLGAHPYVYGGTDSNLSAVNGQRVFSDWTNRRTAASVRCVKDTELGEIVHR